MVDPLPWRALSRSKQSQQASKPLQVLLFQLPLRGFVMAPNRSASTSALSHPSQVTGALFPPVSHASPPARAARRAP